MKRILFSKLSNEKLVICDNKYELNIYTYFFKYLYTSFYYLHISAR